jgi:hypothetical protein
MTTLFLVAVTAFILGSKYGTNVDKRAVTLALAGLTKAKAVFSASIRRAQATAKADVEHLESLAQKYL